MRIVLDTNVLVAAAYAPNSASRRIVEACLGGRLQWVVSTALRREYDHILSRALHNTNYQQRLSEWIAGGEVIEPAQTPRVVPDDREDDKVIAAAVAGNADALVTSDRHLLVLDPYQDLRILPAGRFAELYLATDS